MARPRSLRRREDFARIYDTGIKFVAPSFVLYVLSAGETATAVVASKRVGKAVRRNRAKRLLRELLRQRLLAGRQSSPAVQTLLSGAQQPDPSAGAWIVLVARSGLPDRSIHDLLAEMDRLLERAAVSRRLPREQSDASTHEGS